MTEKTRKKNVTINFDFKVCDGFVLFLCHRIVSAFGYRAGKEPFIRYFRIDFPGNLPYDIGMLCE